MSEAEPGSQAQTWPLSSEATLPGGLGSSQKWHTHRPSPVLQVAEPEQGLGAWELVVSLQEEGGAPPQAML